MRKTCRSILTWWPILAHALAIIRRDVFGGTRSNPDAVAAAALYHDAPEILTGDLPTPVKYYNPGIREAYRQVEEVAGQKLSSMLPPAMRRLPTRPLLQPTGPGGDGAGEGGGQALRLCEMRGGAQGRQHGI
ncbi:MAG: YfbR-like 5'-deoxynucleotidase [Oscillospiraceae bacterium]